MVFPRSTHMFIKFVAMISYTNGYREILCFLTVILQCYICYGLKLRDSEVKQLLIDIWKNTVILNNIVGLLITVESLIMCPSLIK